MNIVLPVHHFPPRYHAGAELYTYRLAQRLQAHAHRVEVVCIEAVDRGAVGELEAAQDEYHGLPVWRLSYNLMDDPDWHIRYDHPRLGEWFADYVARTRPDLAHFQAGYLIGVAPLQAAVAAGVPTALTLHDYWYLCPRSTLQRSDGTLCAAAPENPAGCAWCERLTHQRFRVADKLTLGLAGQVAQALPLNDRRDWVAARRQRLLSALKLPDAVIAPSRFLAQQFAPFVDPERLRVLRYGLDAQLSPARRAFAGNVVRIGYTGQIASHKGVHLLVEAFRTLRDGGRELELHLHGGLEAYPDYVERLRRLAGDDTRIHLHGRYQHEQLPQMLAGLDVTVAPSTWYENSPLAIMEAHAAGVPVVTAALGGMAELVDDGVDGLHFKSGDARDLARQLQRVIDEPGLLAQLRDGAARRPLRNVDDEMQDLLGLYRRLATARVPIDLGRVASEKPYDRPRAMAAL